MALAVNGNVLGCMVNGELDLLRRPVVEGEARPCDCDNPNVADGSPMRGCAYRAGALARCGCPALDRKKNPELWAHYVGLVRRQLEAKTHKKTITITCFASGALLLDAELLDEVFRTSPSLQRWNGKLNLQCVDLKYEPVFQEVQERQEDDFNKRIGGTAALVLGCGALYGASKIENQKAKRTVQVLGGCSVIAGIVLIALTMQERDKAEIEKAMRQFTSEVAPKLPIGNISFFGSDTSCLEGGKKADLVLGYDIEDTTDVLERLRAQHLRRGGKLFAVGKTPQGPILLKGTSSRPIEATLMQNRARVRIRA